MQSMYSDLADGNYYNALGAAYFSIVFTSSFIYCRKRSLSQPFKQCVPGGKGDTRGGCLQIDTRLESGRHCRRESWSGGKVVFSYSRVLCSVKRETMRSSKNLRVLVTTVCIGGVCLTSVSWLGLCTIVYSERNSK